MALDYSQLQALNALMSEGGPDEWTPPDQQHGASAASSKRMTPASIGPAASTASASAMLAASKQQVRVDRIVGFTSMSMIMPSSAGAYV
jgi:hypothetical protein